jgi:hypothetical protein
MSKDERKQRLLEEIWPEMSVLTREIPSILAERKRLDRLDEEEQSRHLLVLQDRSMQLSQSVSDLMNSPRVLELLEPAKTINVSMRHANCCPPPPFPPCYVDFPFAGYLRMMFLSLFHCLHVLINPLLGLPPASQDDVAYFAYELCRTFAGIENDFANTPAAYIPAFSSLVIARVSCPSNVRRWLWYKLVHFEEISQYIARPLKKHLAVIWDKPELETEDLKPWVVEPPQQQLRILTAGEVEAVTLAMVTLDDE